VAQTNSPEIDQNEQIPVGIYNNLTVDQFRSIYSYEKQRVILFHLFPEVLEDINKHLVDAIPPAFLTDEGTLVPERCYQNVYQNGVLECPYCLASDPNLFVAHIPDHNAKVVFIEECKECCVNNQLDAIFKVLQARIRTGLTGNRQDIYGLSCSLKAAIFDVYQDLKTNGDRRPMIKYRLEFSGQELNDSSIAFEIDAEETRRLCAYG
jgi:hypothetical protein